MASTISWFLLQEKPLLFEIDSFPISRPALPSLYKQKILQTFPTTLRLHFLIQTLKSVKHPLIICQKIPSFFLMIIHVETKMLISSMLLSTFTSGNTWKFFLYSNQHNKKAPISLFYRHKKKTLLLGLHNFTKNYLYTEIVQCSRIFLTYSISSLKLLANVTSDLPDNPFQQAFKEHWHQGGNRDRHVAYLDLGI